MSNNNVSILTTPVVVSSDTFGILKRIVQPEDFYNHELLNTNLESNIFRVQFKHDSKWYALKCRDKHHKDYDVEFTKQECIMLLRLQHPFVTPVLFIFETEETLYSISPYYEYRDLSFVYKMGERWTEEAVQFLMAESVLAIEYIHQQHIIHRDIKPKNILIDQDGHVRLTDFNVSTNIMADLPYEFNVCGSPAYIAPEVLDQSGYDKSVDWWSLGICTYELLTGKTPFEPAGECCTQATYEARLARNILTAPLHFPDEMSEICQDFIRKLLIRESDARLGCGPKQALEIKQHAFFKGINFEALSVKSIPSPLLQYPKYQAFIDVAMKQKSSASEVRLDTALPPNSFASDFSLQTRTIDSSYEEEEKSKEVQRPFDLASLYTIDDSITLQVSALSHFSTKWYCYGCLFSMIWVKTTMTNSKI